MVRAVPQEGFDEDGSHGHNRCPVHVGCRRLHGWIFQRKMALVGRPQDQTQTPAASLADSNECDAKGSVAAVALTQCHARLAQWWCRSGAFTHAIDHSK